LAIPHAFDVEGADPEAGAFLPPMLYHCAEPDRAERVHDTEAFGPVATSWAIAASTMRRRWPIAAAAALSYRS
jgi:hypothetical protein